MPYCAYLRKSRKDLEAEQRGEGETLKRHETQLKDLALRMQIKLDAIYKEIVSADTITSRPVMQKLLSEVEAGKWDGVFVMEIERLARGDTIDQGVVAQTFKFSSTKIITPAKTYDPNDEFDEEYFEFGLFMSRREYKTIKRRLIKGREASAREGKFVGSIAPYGYERYKLPNDKGYSLKIVPEKADVVRFIFKLYTEGLADENGIVQLYGMQKIAHTLNDMHIPPTRHDYWMKATIKDILNNPTYAGKIRWGYNRTIKKTIDGQTVTSYREGYEGNNVILVDGLHEAIISEDTFEKAQEIMSLQPAAPVGYKSEVKSPLAGLMVCELCGRKMTLRKSYVETKSDYLVCHARACQNVSAPFYLVEEKVLSSLGQMLTRFKLEQQQAEPAERLKIEDITAALARIENDIKTYNKQLTSAQELLEKDVYTIEDYVKRSTTLKEKIAEAEEDKEKMFVELEKTKNAKEQRAKLIPKIEHVLSTYSHLTNASEKNKMLKEVIEKVLYCKSVHGGFKGFSADNFRITVFPKLQ